jgi:hypothetical protein
MHHHRVQGMTETDLFKECVQTFNHILLLSVFGQKAPAGMCSARPFGDGIWAAVLALRIIIPVILAELFRIPVQKRKKPAAI